jgi:hypothetical protein
MALSPSHPSYTDNPFASRSTRQRAVSYSGYGPAVPAYPESYAQPGAGDGHGFAPHAMPSINELRMMAGDAVLDEHESFTMMQPAVAPSRESRFSAPCGFGEHSQVGLERTPSFINLLRAQQELEVTAKDLEELFS